MLVHACQEVDLVAGQPPISRDHVGADLFVGVAYVRFTIRVVDGGRQIEAARHQAGPPSGVPPPPPSLPRSGPRFRLPPRRPRRRRRRSGRASAAASGAASAGSSSSATSSSGSGSAVTLTRST